MLRIKRAPESNYTPDRSGVQNLTQSVTDILIHSAEKTFRKTKLCSVKPKKNKRYAKHFDKNCVQKLSNLKNMSSCPQILANLKNSGMCWIKYNNALREKSKIIMMSPRRCGWSTLKTSCIKILHL